MQIVLLQNIFQENLEFLIILRVFFNFEKNRSQKLSMLDEKQRQFWNLQWILHKVIQSDFQFSSYFFLSIFKDTLFWNFDLATIKKI